MGTGGRRSTARALAGDRAVTFLLLVLLVGALAIRTQSAVDRPKAGRFFDEHYSVDNITSMLRTGRPANGFYLGLSYLPQTALLAASEKIHRATGIRAFGIWGPHGKGFSATAYVICRMLNVVVAIGGLWLTFAIGRKLWSPAAGLLAATALAAAPRHLRCSVEYKPDIWVVLCTLLAIWWALAAIQRPVRGHFLRAGLATGLALAAKYTGIGAALPVAVAGLGDGGWRQPRRWVWLALAALVALVAFAALNPYLGTILPYAPRVLGAYDRMSDRQGLSHTTVLLREAEFLIDNLGAVVVALAIAGALWICWSALRRRGAGPEPVVAQSGPEEAQREGQLGEVMLVVHIAGYSLFYASATTLFHGQNYLPVVPSVCLLAAFATTRGFGLIARRGMGAVDSPPPVATPRMARPSGRAALLVTPWILTALVGLSLYVQERTIYRETVPSTWALAGQRLKAALGEDSARQIAVELGEERLDLAPQRRRPLVLAYDLSADTPDGTPAGSDAEVFPASRLTGDAATAYERRRQATPVEGRHRISATPFEARGESIVMLVHPWRPVAVGPWSAPGAGAGLALPASADGELVSIEARVPRGVARPATLILEPGGIELPLHEADSRGAVWLQTPRFAAPPGNVARLTVSSVGPPSREGVTLRAIRWQPNGRGVHPDTL